MKLSLLSFAWLVVSIVAAPVDGNPPSPGIDDATRPPPKTMEELAPPITAAVVLDVEPLLRPGAKRQLARYGPFIMPPAKANLEAGHKHSGGLMNGATGIANLDYRPLLKGDVTLAIAEVLAASLDPEGFNIMHTIQGGICKECTVLAAKLDAVFENGTRADVSSGVYLHHVVTFNMGDRKMPTDFVHQWLPFCPGGGAVQTIGENLLGLTTAINRGRRSSVFGFGAVDEFKQLFTTPDGKFDSGFYLAQKDQMLMQAELVNYRKEPQSIYIQVDFEWLPGKVGKEAVTGLSSVTDCADPMAFSGKGQAGKLVSKGAPVNKPGTILSMRGHMHDGGESMTIKINDKLACVSTADYSTGYGGNIVEGGLKNWTTISKMGQCDGVWPVRKGDIVKLEAAFDEVKHPARESDGMEQMEMGIVAFTFVQD